MEKDAVVTEAPGNQNPINFKTSSNTSVSLSVVLSLILLFTVFAGLVGYLLGRGTFNQSSSQTEESAVTPSSTPSETSPSGTQIPAAKEDPTKDWKTYTNSTYGFEFKYPNYYKVIKEKTNAVELGFAQTPDQALTTYLTVSLQPTLNPDALPSCTEGKWDEWSSQGIPCVDKTSMDNTATLGGKKAKSFTIGYARVDAEFRVVRTAEAPAVELKMNVSGGGLSWIFDQILSTFRFLD